MYKVILTVLVIVVLAFGYSVLKDTIISPGEANVESAYDAIVEVQNSVKDTAGDMADMIGRESAFENEAPDGLASKLWQWARSLMMWLSTFGIVAVLKNDLIEHGTMRVLAEAGEEINVCPSCGEECEKEFCEVCIAEAEMDSMHYGGR